MKILRQKEYSDAGLGIGLVGGFSTGALAGNYVQKKVQNLHARRKYDPEGEAEKLEKSAESYEEAARKLRQNKDYMKLVEEKRAKQKEIDKKYPDADSDWEAEMDALDEEYGSKLRAGDPDTLESFALSERSAAQKIRQNPKEARKRHGKEAESNIDRPIGATIGGITGAIAGGAIGSRIKRK